ncbi:MAG TPA: DUF2461 domain-containing protein [Phycisphaerales bacterium]|nr:DUF2461 domain-containing protein [Phycisphaerales bacterium]
MPAPVLTPALFTFLRNLKRNNTAEWFHAHKADYEQHVKAPLLAFIEALQPRMAKVSPRIRVIPKAVGGSLQRLNRDTRFSKDKSPYKTAASLHFPVEGAGDLLLGYHLTLAPGEGEVLSYYGLWEPDGPALNAVRSRIITAPGEWKKAAPRAFRAVHTFKGDSLKRAPKVNGEQVADDHPSIEDLKRKSFAACATLDEKTACAPDFLDRYMDTVKAGVPLMQFLCRAVDVKF